MERKAKLALLMDFYGGLLTEHRREVVSLYCEEDLSLQEIADRLGISRQGVHDAVHKAEQQLTHFEETLALAERYLNITREIGLCREILVRIQNGNGHAGDLEKAIASLDRIERNEG